MFSRRLLLRNWTRAPSPSRLAFCRARARASSEMSTPTVSASGYSRARLSAMKRLALSAPLHQIAQRRQLGFVKLALEFQIQLDPFPAEHMCEQVLRI